MLLLHGRSRHVQDARDWSREKDLGRLRLLRLPLLVRRLIRTDGDGRAASNPATAADGGRDIADPAGTVRVAATGGLPRAPSQPSGGRAVVGRTLERLVRLWEA